MLRKAQSKGKQDMTTQRGIKPGCPSRTSSHVDDDVESIGCWLEKKGLMMEFRED
jgi:hypothetical protein